jgi:hypothetical protein
MRMENDSIFVQNNQIIFLFRIFYKVYNQLKNFDVKRQEQFIFI